MFSITEPSWGLQLLQRWNTTVYYNQILKTITPIFADIFVFTYPIFLSWRYIKGIIKSHRPTKIHALSIFTSAIAGFLCNSIIQTIFEKQRPELYITNKSQLILSHLPTDPFPSDHASVSAAMATATLLVAHQTNDPLLKYIGVFFAFASLVMGISRVGVAIHRPTDIIMGWCCGIFVAYMVIQWIHTRLIRRIYTQLINIQEWIGNRGRDKTERSYGV